MQQPHPSLGQHPPALAMIAGRAGRSHIGPNMPAAQVPRHNMINRQVVGMLAAVLAGFMVAPEHLLAGQFEVRSRSVNHVIQSYHRRAGVGPPWRVDHTAPIGHQAGLFH